MKSGSSLPKCPNALVFLNIGLLSYKFLIMYPGLRSKFLNIIFRKSNKIKLGIILP